MPMLGQPGQGKADADVIEARVDEIVPGVPGVPGVQAVDFVSDDPAFLGTDCHVPLLKQLFDKVTA